MSARVVERLDAALNARDIEALVALFALDMAGVIVMGIRDDRLAWARLYVEPVEQVGAGIDAAVQEMTGDR